MPYCQEAQPHDYLDVGRREACWPCPEVCLKGRQGALAGQQGLLQGFWDGDEEGRAHPRENMEEMAALLETQKLLKSILGRTGTFEQSNFHIRNWTGD